MLEGGMYEFTGGRMGLRPERKSIAIVVHYTLSQGPALGPQSAQDGRISCD